VKSMLMLEAIGDAEVVPPPTTASLRSCER
jgi:hypothetical protein